MKKESAVNGKLDWEDKSATIDLWVEERHRNYYGTRFRCKKVLFSGKSKYQYIDVVETAGHGRMLFNDGIVMFSEKDEFVYHEMMAHIPLFIYPQPKKVLIIGGGDGGVAREVLRHESVVQCVLVEIDEMVVEVSKRYFPKISCSFTDSRLQVNIQDGLQFVKNTEQKFDIVLVDSTDPLGPAKPLFSEQFYKDVSVILAEDGLLVVQAESPFFEVETQKFILQSLQSVFPLVSLYNYSNTVYPGGLWSFAFASKKYHPIKDFEKERVKKAKWDLLYYNEDIHLAAFSQPEFIKRQLKNFYKV